MGFFDRIRRKKTEKDGASFSQDEGSSLSISLNKETMLEQMTVSDDPVPGFPPFDDSISNEMIMKGDQILDTYSVLSDAIKGGMGSVWKVHHRSWNMDLAMKRPQPRFFAEGAQNRKKNFIRECEAWINLGLHPNIVSCYYVREIGGIPSIFSEWMENGSLENRIQDGLLYEGTKEEVRKRILDIAIQFARGLHYAHESGDHLVHQDVKPDNLLLTKEWDAKVADFGLARARKQLQNAGDTQVVESSGYTPAYCSSEQYLNGTLTRRTDIYSWAVSVLEMYLGNRPWKKGTEAGRCCRKYFPECRVEIPESLQELLVWCLSEDPDDRPHDFGVVIDKLNGIYEEQTSEKYPRPQYVDVTKSAESLNNKALSFLDLKRYEEAEKFWKQAIENNSGHVESIYNQLIYRWEKAEIDDIEVLKKIRNADNGSAEAMLCQLQIQIGRADQEAHRCIDILLHDRNIQTGSFEEGELKRLIDICQTACKSDELVCAAPEGLLIADENDNLGFLMNDGKDSILVFKDSSGRITEQYEGSGKIRDVLFDPSYSKIALLCEEEVLVYDRGKGLILKGDEAVRTVSEWQKQISCGIDGSAIVSYDAGDDSNGSVLSRLTSSSPEYIRRINSLIYSKAENYRNNQRTYGSGDVRYILRPQGQILKTLRMRTEQQKDKALSLSPTLYLDAAKEHVYRRSVPNLQYRPQMIVSRVISYEENLRNGEEYSGLMTQAIQFESGGDYKTAVRYIDRAMNVTGYFNDNAALDKRRKIMDTFENKVFDRVLDVNHYRPAEEDKWYEVSDDVRQTVIDLALTINKDTIGTDELAKHSQITQNSFNVRRSVISTQFPGIYIVTARGINSFEHPRYGDDMYQSRSWTAVIDTNEKKIRKAIGPAALGFAQCFAGEFVVDNAFLVTDPIAATISNDGNGMIISCSEEKLFSDSFSQIRDYIGPGLDYIFPTIANDYYLLIGRDYVALAFMSREESIIVWEDYSGYSEFVGFNREKSTFTILRGENESVTREILWNFETPTLKSRIVKWDSLDYFGPIIKRSSYF